MPERNRPAPPGGTPWLWLIIGLAVAARLGAALYLGNEVVPQPGTADQVSYHTLALRVLDGHGFSFGTGWWPATPADQPTAHWSYLYVLFLATVYGIAGPNPLAARLLQAVVVGVLHPWLTHSVAHRLFGRRVALVAAMVVAGYAYFVYYAGALMTESFFFVALLWSLDAAARLGREDDGLSGSAGLGRWITLGIALATAVLLRQAFLVCLPVFLVWIALRLRPSKSNRAGAPRMGGAALAARIGVTLLVVGSCILPWTARNHRVFQTFVLLNTNAGFAFYWGNHPIHGNSFVPILPGSVYGTLIPDELAALNEGELDRALLGRGLGFIAADPMRYVRLSATRVLEFVKFWPSPGSGRLSNVARTVSFGLCAPFMLAGVILALRTQGPRDHGHPRVARAETWLVLSVAVVYSVVHVLTWTLVRYRLPVDAVLMPFAAFALVALVDRLRSRERRAERGALAAS